MIAGISSVKVTGLFHRDLTRFAIRELEAAGVMDYYIMPSRSVTLQKRRAPFGLVLDHRVMDDPADRVIAFVPSEWGRSVANLMIKGAGLDRPGRGSLFVEEVTISRAHDLCDPSTNTCLSEFSFPHGAARLRDDLTGICCIVQRGQGEVVARIVLETGTCVPLVTFGQGTGVRDRMGLIRIAVPAEKEVVLFAATDHDAGTIMDIIIDVAKLDLPGRGYTYLFPLAGGLINMKVFRGRRRHAASVEQIVAAIDEMKGDSRWRAIVADNDRGSRTSRDYLQNLQSLSFICDEGRGEELTRVAMNAGAPGATTSRLRYAGRLNLGEKGISPAREWITMVVHPSQIESITGVMADAGALDDRTHGLFYLSEVSKAYTYIERD